MRSALFPLGYPGWMLQFQGADRLEAIDFRGVSMTQRTVHVPLAQRNLVTVA